MMSSHWKERTSHQSSTKEDLQFGEQQQYSAFQGSRVKKGRQKCQNI